VEIAVEKQSEAVRMILDGWSCECKRATARSGVYVRDKQMMLIRKVHRICCVKRRKEISEVLWLWKLKIVKIKSMKKTVDSYPFTYSTLQDH